MTTKIKAGVIGDGVVGTTQIANDAITSALIADNAVGIPALAVSDGSNGQVLTTNGSGTLSFSTVSGTTINNNADNRIITGSGTANTLNGESTLTFDGNTLTADYDIAGFGKNIVLKNTNNSSIYSRGSAIGFEVSNGSATKDAAFIKGGRASTTSGGYLYFETADSSWNTPAERMRIDSAGNVGIGLTSNSTYPLQISASGTDPSLAVGVTTNSHGIIQILSTNTGAGTIHFGDSDSIWDGYISYGHSNQRLDFGVNGAAKMYLMQTTQSNGALRIGTTSPLASSPEKMSIQGAAGLSIKTTDYYDYAPLYLWQDAANATNSTTNIYAAFISHNDVSVGSITSVGSTTSYNTTSDYRLKENVSYDWDATTRLKQLKPARFNFTTNADTIVDGFLAHEVQDIVPEAITGEKDAMKDEEYEITPAVLDEDGNVVTEAVRGTRTVPNYQSIDQSKLVPLLVKTIQELEARITTLEG